MLRRLLLLLLELLQRLLGPVKLEVPDPTQKARIG